MPPPHRLIAPPLALLLAACATGGEPPNPSFDCAAAKGEIAALICSDGRLAALDLRLAGRVEAARAEIAKTDGTEEALERFDAGEERWRAERDACVEAADPRACVEAAYLAREGELVALHGLEPPRASVTWICEDNREDRVTATFFDLERPAARLERAGEVAAASLTRTASGARYETADGRSLWIKGGAAILEWPADELRTCRISGAAR